MYWAKLWVINHLKYTIVSSHSIEAFIYTVNHRYSNDMEWINDLSIALKFCLTNNPVNYFRPQGKEGVGGRRVHDYNYKTPLCKLHVYNIDKPIHTYIHNAGLHLLFTENRRIME